MARLACDTDLVYPAARRADAHSTFHGVVVEDPYEWLTDDRSVEALAWRAAQARLARESLARAPQRENLRRILAAQPRHWPQRLPVLRGEREFRFGASRNGGFRLTVVADGATDTEATVFDPVDVEGLRDRRLQPQFTEISPGGRYATLGLTASGSDWVELRVFDIVHDKLLPKTWPLTAQLTVAWLPDDSGFYYNVTRARFAASPVVDGVYLHELSGRDAADTLVFDHGTGHGHAALPWLLPDGRTLVVKTLDFVTQQAELHVRAAGSPQWRQLLREPSPCNVIGEHRGELYVETTWNAPRGRILALPLSGDTPWREVVTEMDDVVDLAHHTVRTPRAALLGDSLVVTCLEHGTHRLRIHGTDSGARGSVPIPGHFTVLDIASSGEVLDIAVTDYTTPYARHRYDGSSGVLTRVERISVSGFPDTATTERSFAASRDGTRVPYTVIRSRAAGPAPTLLYGYGGWGTALTPEFRPDLAAWVALGGTYVVANVRGGGEYGQRWHDAGARLQRPRTFEDFCAVGAALVARGICDPAGLCARGVSNGGLLVTAAMQQCPSLFAAVVAEVPLLDVLHLRDLPAGGAMIAEFGDPAADPEAFECIRGYSPLQNVRPQSARAALLVVPAERDERVSAGQACKFVAALQAESQPGQVVLLRMVEGEGHVAWPPDVLRDVLADELAFLHAHVSTRIAASLRAEAGDGIE